MRGVFDLEANGLLDHTSINYLTAPFSLKPTYRLWCAVIQDIDTGAVYRFAGMEELRNGFLPMFLKLDTIIGHNIIDFDLLALKLVFGIDYVIGEKCYINGREVEIVDTLVWSKCLNPDRYGGHSLDEWGKRLGIEKIDWRSEAIALGLIETNAPKGAEFGQYHPKMLDYNERDCGVNTQLYWALLEEIGDWPWANPLALEQQVRDIVTRQSHRGFWFDALLAQANVRELDKLMEELRAIVEPTLPPKLMGKTKLKEYQGPAKPFKKDGTPSHHMLNFANKHEGTIEQRDDGYYLKAYGNEWKLPLGDTPIKTHEPATIKDTTHIKGWLVELGWQPSQYKERDLTVNTKKQKLTQEKFEETVERYVEQTLASPFRDHRCEELGVRPSKLREKLLKWDLKRPLKVYTNPTITVGMEKEICPGLLKLADKFPHAKLVSEYLTYSHRRNSILGGGYDPDEIDEDDEFAGKGFLAAERISVDGRIPTPADSCGAGTSRFKHRLVANIPRITSLYGGNMRAMFGVDVAQGFVQMGYDFASLEAMIESHYCHRYDTEEGKPYCASLVQEKPNDVHTKTAQLIETMVSAAIGKAFPFTRGAAKPVKYACVPMDTQALTRHGWKNYEELVLGEEILAYNADTGLKEWTILRGKVRYEDALTYNLSWGSRQFRATADHRWYVDQRQTRKGGVKPEVRVTEALNTASNVIVNAPFNPAQDKEATCRTLSQGKYEVDWVARVVGMSHAERVSFLEGFVIADGYWHHHKQTPVWRWAQNPGNLFDAALTASYLVHDGSLTVASNSKTSDVKVVTLNVKSRMTGQRMQKSVFGFEDVWCPQTDLGTWVMKQGDCITITGNCAYGAQPPRVAKTVGCSVEIGALIHKAYWEAAKPLALLGEKLKHYWETTGGKKFILGLDGRKIPTRSASALINSLFQSAGVICAKRAMVLHEQKLKAAGLSIDFFKDDWKNAKFVQQLIAYHDEAQLEMHKSLVTWKMWPIKEWQVFSEKKQKMVDSPEVEEAHAAIKEFKAANPGWSEVGHTEKCLFIGYCEAGRLIQEAVLETSRYYKLNVTLAADYILGKTWKDCH